MKRKVFLTGGAGFLGRSLMEWAAKAHPDWQFTVYSRDEEKHAKVKRRFPQHAFLLGDVRDYDRLEVAIAGHDIVIHGAALKYVPECELHVGEAIATNLEGSRNVAKAAVRAGIERVVGISTDKAVQPINVYGLTKLLNERLFLEADAMSDTRFNLARYGNVVGSTGSVIPLFRRQAREHGEVTITDPSMTRFWLSVWDAAELIDRCLKEQTGGTVLIPRLPAISLGDTARAAAQVELGEGAAKVKYTVVGTRLGEKIHEDLLGKTEVPYAELIDEGMMRLHSQRHGFVKQPILDKATGRVTEGYRSSAADRFLTPDEMARMIREAPALI